MLRALQTGMRWVMMIRLTVGMITAHPTGILMVGYIHGLQRLLLGGYGVQQFDRLEPVPGLRLIGCVFPIIVNSYYTRLLLTNHLHRGSIRISFCTARLTDPSSIVRIVPLVRPYLFIA